jgi:hypothetical protein
MTMAITAFPHYIIRASVNGVRTVTYDVTYNPATQEFSLDSFGPIQPGGSNYGKPYPWVGVSSSAAVAAYVALRVLPWQLRRCRSWSFLHPVRRLPILNHPHLVTGQAEGVIPRTPCGGCTVRMGSSTLSA